MKQKKCNEIKENNKQSDLEPRSSISRGPAFSMLNWYIGLFLKESL